MVTNFPAEFGFHVPTRIVFGEGSLARLPEVIDEACGGTGASVFLVTGKHSLKAQGILDRVLGSLGRFHVTHFDGAVPFPASQDVDRALEACRRADPDAVVAIGGGSAMDLAKLTAVLMANPGPSIEYGKRLRTIEQPGLPFIAVPTTSGSSSEVTPGMAMWQWDENTSYNVRHTYMFPTVALVDPDLTMSMPRDLAAASGVDAFSSAFESYWATGAQPMTDTLALGVVRMFAENLEASCRDGGRAARAACALAATMSGVGYSNCPPNVCHAFSRPLTIFWRVAHGQAVGVTLPAFLERNAPAIAHKLPPLWEALGVGGLDEAVARVTSIMRNCGLETRLGELGVSEGDLDRYLDVVAWERLATMPTDLSRQEARDLLKSLL
ncbi:MAG: iron-containing alcohol dehydrogenase [Dehalococcoidia bacterium]|nr:iron-containing alcohol dehydrogenase [Dehalococcoidia bacterium]